jgi:hypothetical protein
MITSAAAAATTAERGSRTRTTDTPQQEKGLSEHTRSSRAGEKDGRKAANDAEHTVQVQDATQTDNSTNRHSTASRITQ